MAGRNKPAAAGVLAPARPTRNSAAGRRGPWPDPNPTILRLRIYDPGTGQGLGFAAIQLWSSAGTLLHAAQAEADGTLQLPLPAADTLRLLVQVPGYHNAEELIRPGTAAGTLAIPLRPGPSNCP
ncbi:carboxypeptidase-like regulatory domain-containing protein [Hymenobacter cellulosilyticus]|uniref:Carboxypeptidase-like regulatory domain-containing protein n=1 Tax=Hymenobacter cellulosilyticus TaxID=2932248 RepID=A0A8T9QAT8_9BACT|nr:carboxypeptidase-like regulatory domain-containing protein [Hymenobacter cellulosilyticus]UOQ74285.1 carboxypeptidase-like regulatory domain-containing protein [Hymenobacter cellulosilyticus]